MHPRDRLTRLLSHDRDPEEKESRSRESGESRSTALLGGCDEDERRDREQREVMKIERNGGQKSDRREVARALGQDDRQQEKEKHRKRKERIGTGFRGIEKQQRGDARQDDEPEFRGARGESEHADEKSDHRSEGERTREDVRRKALADRHERLLEEIEERRSRVVGKSVHERAEGKPRCPESEDLVEPQRAVDCEPEPRRARNEDDEESSREREARATLRRRCDALS